MLHHDLEVRLDPGRGRIVVVDHIEFPAAHDKTIRFVLHAPLAISVQGARLESLDNPASNRFREYALTVARLPARVTLSYTLHVAAAQRHAGHGMPAAWLSPAGVFLDGGSHWYPWFSPAPITFKMRISAPGDWQIISQDKRSLDGSEVTWETAVPQQEIYLLGGPYRRTARLHGPAELAVYLLEDDPQVAERYLRVMGQYLDFYSALIGDYPYAQFAVVENQWQTGYGMPSFTLLGSRVLRLPFILHSSLPHEILHNWWGNGVYVDAASGNWSEGLTAYLADHLIKEAQGQGPDYRRKALERYANYAAEGRDIPLREFRARHDDATQAVGYGKTLMLFHMLRRETGDGAFVAGLKAFWERHRFTTAGFDDYRELMQQMVGKPLQALDTAWLDRAGAPALAIERAGVTRTPDGLHQIDLTIVQTQSGDPYKLTLPLTVQPAGASAPRRFELAIENRVTTWTQRFAERPARLDIDPHYDVFRLLDPNERPPSLGRLFGAQRQLLVVPGDAAPELQESWRTLAEAWTQRFGNVEWVTDTDLERLPDDTAVWLLGWNNGWFAAAQPRWKGAGQQLSPRGLRVGEAAFDAGAVVVVLDPDNRRTPLGFIGARTGAEVAALARKLPHYGSFGRLVFASDSVDNIRRDALPVVSSPLSRVFSAPDPGPPADQSAPLTDLIGVPLRFD